MPFVTPDQILGECPMEWRQAALEDSATGATPEEVWSQLQESVTDDIAAALSPAYDLPAPDADPDTSPLIRIVRSAARVFTLATLYRRRSVPDAENPWAALAKETMKSLRAMGQKEAKGPDDPQRTHNRIRVIGAPSVMTPSATPRRRLRGTIAQELLWMLAIGAAVFAVLYFSGVRPVRLVHEVTNVTNNITLMSRTVKLTAAPLPVEPVAALAYRATPMVLTITLDVSRPTATGWDSLTAEIRTQQIDDEAPLASVSLADPAGAGPFTLAFSGPQMNQDLAGAAEATFWLVIYTSKDAGETLDVWHAGPLILRESGASQMAAAPPNVVGPLSRAAADGLYRTLVDTTAPAEVIPGDLPESTLPNGFGGFLYSENQDEWSIGIRTADGLLLLAPLYLSGNPFTIDPTQIVPSGAAGRSLLTSGTASAQRTLLGLACPTYANDAAADADAALLSGTFYRTTAGGRTVYRKP